MRRHHLRSIPGSSIYYIDRDFLRGDFYGMFKIYSDHYRRRNAVVLKGFDESDGGKVKIYKKIVYLHDREPKSTLEIASLLKDCLGEIREAAGVDKKVEGKTNPMPLDGKPYMNVTVYPVSFPVSAEDKKAAKKETGKQLPLF